ncbi:MAG: DUF4231 domain-containing protein [Burkholderiales bacterium]|nr:DUF4231 domain-containing protein [Anaerolineae bacterium]
MAETQSKWPTLASDLEEIQKFEVSRRKLSQIATETKDSFHRVQLGIIGLTLLLVALGAIQASQTRPENILLPILQALLSFGVGALTLINRELKWQETWLKERAASETYKREYYRFLARIDEYASTADPKQLLRQKITDINLEVGFDEEQ